MIEIKMWIDTIFASWIYICIVFSIFTFVAGIIYLSVSFLIWAIINLEGKIRTEKVWREAINLYKKKDREEKAIKADLKDCIWNENNTESEDKQ